MRARISLAVIVLCTACSGEAEKKHSYYTTPTGTTPTGETCGNGKLDAGEVCDGELLNGKTCQSLGSPAGTLACAEDCTFDLSGCGAPTTCGNGTIDGGEVCDGAKLNNMTCATLGYDGGTLACAENCLNFDPSSCTGGCEPDCSARECGPDPVCGESCGTCYEGTCDNGACVSACVPNCVGRQCGPDPVCGVPCGTCSSGTCNGAGACETVCVPNCAGRECGLDPRCGTSCGTCDVGTCSAGGQCIQECLPNCTGRVCGPDPSCGVSCGTCSSGTCNTSGQCSGVVADGLQVQVTWNTTGTDLDLHLKPTDGAYCTTDACYYADCKVDVAVGSRPEWDGVSGLTAGDPILDLDDIDGYGPELVHVKTPVAGQYVVGAHYYGASASGGAVPPTVATVKVTVRGSVAFQQSRTLNQGDLWEAATIAWSGTTGTVMPADSLQTAWSCEGGTTATGCSTDADCPNEPWPDTQYCSLTLNIAGQCAVGCRSSAGCPSGKVCNGAHECVTSSTLVGWLDPCASSSDCQDGLYCNPLFNHCSEWCSPVRSCAGDATCCPLSHAAQCIDPLGLGFFAYCSNDVI